MYTGPSNVFQILHNGLQGSCAALLFAAHGHVTTQEQFAFVVSLTQQYGFTPPNALVLTQYLISANDYLGQVNHGPFPLSNLFYQFSVGPNTMFIMNGIFPNIVAQNFPAVLGNQYLVAYQYHLITHYVIPAVNTQINIGGEILVGIPSVIYNISNTAGSTLYNISHTFIGWLPWYNPALPAVATALPMSELVANLPYSFTPTLPDLPTPMSTALTDALNNIGLDNPVPHNILQHPSFQTNELVTNDTTIHTHSSASLKLNASVRKLARRFTI